jgi:hypothetical protein
MRRGDLTLEQCCAWAATRGRCRCSTASSSSSLPTCPRSVNDPFDVHAFYKALGVELPRWSRREAPVRCFAAPESHNRRDRNPSCSVSMASGAWNCHGCGARGGAYDAALALGHTPRSAMDLLIAHNLAEPRTVELRVLPGTTVWQPSWAALLAGRHVIVVMDCDPAGRRAAQHIAADLGSIAATVEPRSPPRRECGRNGPAPRSPPRRLWRVPLRTTTRALLSVNTLDA